MDTSDSSCDNLVIWLSLNLSSKKTINLFNKSIKFNRGVHSIRENIFQNSPHQKTSTS